MKLSLFITALILSTHVKYAGAQDPKALQALGSLSPCALECIASAPSTRNCSPIDFACVCADAPLQLAVGKCLLSSCTVKESLTARNVTASLCNEPTRDKSNGIKASNIAMAVLCVCMVLLRFAQKLSGPAANRFAIDDGLIIISFLCLITNNIITEMKLIGNGMGRDVWTIPFDHITEFLKFYWIEEILYFFTSTTLKLSFLFFYKRIFPARNVQRVISLTIIFNVLWGTAFVITAVFQCWPVSHLWVAWDGEHAGHCISINAVAWSNAATGIFVDLWMLAIPISQLIDLKLSRTKKWGVILMFCLGTLATIISIIRLRALVGFGQSTNPTYDQTDTAKWSIVELTVGLVCSCLPSVRSVLVQSLPSVFGSTQDKSTGNQYGGSRIKASKNGIFNMKSSSKGGEDDVAIHCTTSFGATQDSKSEDEVELVYVNNHVKGGEGSVST
ncbi:hypothetical protein HBI38_103580 [Parastagonospora nodorum]|nr:hypothetical protein HBI06_183910 [Parastagonospora nodorum]KAH4240977.1 hypothetical protein HBI05_103290 [Parastagonospora nodorum]KAH4937788.1 hypothetical protein HBI79_064380 [Parastagonospora nodorum]KAH4947978.1 hypothetical protein HBH74_037360 [Parastagonospora nodorum]KAH4963205.1 hypothetical protein HBH73_069630 [Parastagonospora nodorum]